MSSTPLSPDASQGKDTTIPLWLRFVRLFIKEARPSMRDVVLAGLALAFALTSKVANHQLTWSLSVRNMLEAQFPIVAATMVFFAHHIVKASRLLIQEVKAEAGETEYDPYPSLHLPERIKATKKNEMPPYFRLQIVSFAAMFIFTFLVIGVLSWKANALRLALSEQRNASSPDAMPTRITPQPSPTQQPTAIITTQVPTPAPSPSVRKFRTKRPTAAQKEEWRRIDRDLNYNKP